MNSLNILGYQKKDLLSQRDIDTNQQYLLNLFLNNNNNKKRVVSTLFLYIVIFCTACDFKSPEQWQTPTWYLPLTVPLVDNIYSFDGMAQDSTIIEDTLNNTLYISFSDDIVDEGERPGITDDIFNFEIPATPTTSPVFETPPIPIDKQPSEKIGGEPITIPVPLISFSTKPEESIADLCFLPSELDKPLFELVPNGIPILSNLGSSLSEITIETSEGDKPIIQKVHLLTINEGKLGVSYTNSLPLPVKRFNVKYSSYEYDSTRILRDIVVEDIVVDASSSNPFIITSDSPVQFGDSLLIELSIELDIANPPDCPSPLNMKGWSYNPNDQFIVNLEFEIAKESAQNIICTTAEITIDTTINMDFPVIPNIDIKGGFITEEVSTILGDEVNYLKLIANNSLFSPTTIEIEFSNFFEKVNGDDIAIVLGGTIDTTGQDTTFSDTLTSKYLGVPDQPDSLLKFISIGMQVQINKIINGPIALGKTYSLSILELLVSKMKLAYLTAITHDLSFDTPSTNIDAVPQGGVGLQFYDVILILDMYTEIGIPIKLDMELGGIKGGDTVSCKITPPLNVPEINTTGDSARTVITLNRLGQKIEWYHMDNIDGEIPDWDTLYPPSTGSNTIVDVMNSAPEIIAFGGGAEINGSGFLAPNSHLWGSFELIAPMAFIFEQPINIIPAESTPMSPMDPSTKEKFDSSLVEAALNVNINNSSPLGGDLSLLISDSTIFPLFFDSLITGTWTRNKLYQEEKYGYIIDTSIWDTLGIVIDSISYTELDSSSDILKALEVKFFKEESLQFFIGRMFELGFPRSDSIEYHLGYINPEFSKTYESSLVLDNTRMNWVITDQQRYNVAMITFDKSPIQSITDEGTSFIPLTLQTSNFIAVQAYLTLTLDTGGLGRENDTGKTSGSGN